MLNHNCPSCGNGLKIPDEYAGQVGTCKKCGAKFTAPSLADEPPVWPPIGPPLPPPVTPWFWRLSNGQRLGLVGLGLVGLFFAVSVLGAIAGVKPPERAKTREQITKELGLSKEDQAKIEARIKEVVEAPEKLQAELDQLTADHEKEMAGIDAELGRLDREIEEIETDQAWRSAEYAKKYGTLPNWRTQKTLPVNLFNGSQNTGEPTQGQADAIRLVASYIEPDPQAISRGNYISEFIDPRKLLAMDTPKGGGFLVYYPEPYPTVLGVSYRFLWIVFDGVPYATNSSSQQVAVRMPKWNRVAADIHEQIGVERGTPGQIMDTLIYSGDSRTKEEISHIAQARDAARTRTVTR